jgi:DNA-directed RNA polymerase subunit F
MTSRSDLGNRVGGPRAPGDDASRPAGAETGRPEPRSSDPAPKITGRFALPGVPNKNRSLTILFVAAVVLGSIAVVYTWLSQSSVTTTIAWPVSILSAYILITLFSGGDSVKREQIADSYYYFGFLLTLVALTVSLYDLGANDGGADRLNLTARIGVALVTSIIGLAARLFVTQFQTDSDDPAADAFEQLKSTNEAMSTASFAISKASTSIAETADTFATTLAANTKAMKESLENIKQVNTNINRSIQASGQVASERLEKFAQSNAEALQKVTEELVTSFSEVLTGLEQRISDFRFVPDELRQNIDETVNTLARTCGNLTSALSLATEAGLSNGTIWADFNETLRNTTGRLQTLHSNFKALDSASDGLKKFDVAVTGGAAAVSNLSKLYPALAADFKTASSEIASQKDIFTKSKKEIEKELGEIVAKRAALQEEVEALNAITTTLYSHLTGTINKLNDHFAGGEDS